MTRRGRHVQRGLVSSSIANGLPPPESQLHTHTQDICLNWDTTYSVNKFQPAKAFDGDKIDATKNRHILRVMFQGVPWMAELVKYFEEKYNQEVFG